MTNDVLDLLHEQNRRTTRSLHLIMNELRTAAFSEAYVRVLDHHPEARSFEDKITLTLELAQSALRDAARDLAGNPPARIASYELL